MKNGINFIWVNVSIFTSQEKRKPRPFSYKLHGHTFEDVTVKYLGVTLCRSEMKKPEPSVCSKDLKTTTYLSLVGPLLEYSSTVWDLHTKSEIRKLEAV